MGSPNPDINDLIDTHNAPMLGLHDQRVSGNLGWHHRPGTSKHTKHKTSYVSYPTTNRVLVLYDLSGDSRCGLQKVLADLLKPCDHTPPMKNTMMNVQYRCAFRMGFFKPVHLDSVCLGIATHLIETPIVMIFGINIKESLMNAVWKFWICSYYTFATMMVYRQCPIPSTHRRARDLT